MIKGVILDFDGTICLTEESRFYAIKKVLEQVDVEFTKEMWNLKYKRLNSKFIFDDLGLSSQRDELYELSFNFRRAHLKEFGAQIQRGFVEFYQMLQKNNISLVIASGGKREHVAYVMERMNLPLIEYLGREDYANSKPSPDVFQKALEVMGLTPNEVLIFDDSVNGLKAGISLGTKVIAINAKEEVGLDELDLFKQIDDFTQVSFDWFN